MEGKTVPLWQEGPADPLFHKPYIDTDEWRDEPVRHRYVHGGFEGTECRFSFYFPPQELYEGRFFHMLLPVTGFDTAAISAPAATTLSDPIPFAFSSGAYLVESNQGKLNMFPAEDPTITGYRANAAVARYSRVLAAEMYGPHRPYGYAYGGSGGAYKTFACLENCPGVWDGGVPFVHGSNMSIPYMFTVQAHALRLLRDKLPAIIDAVEPGGSGDMYAGLNVEERQALAEATRMGFPPRAWFAHERIALAYTGILAMFMDNLIRWDPDYFKDFWTVPGYLGYDAPESLRRARFQHRTRITRVIKTRDIASLGLMVSMPARLADARGEMPAAVALEKIPQANLQGCSLTLTSGAASGHVLYVSGVLGDMVMVGFGEAHFQELTKMKEGDEVLIDNAPYLAVQTYHRHQIPTPDFYVWDQFLAAGRPVYPQRPRVLGPRFARHAMGNVLTGRFAGRMIVVQCLVDEAAFPWQADWYRSLVQAALGAEIDDRYRLYFMDNAMHVAPRVTPGEYPAATTRIVDYSGAVRQALRDLANWVEKGLAPPPSTTYRVVDGQIEVPPTAAERKGIQPVVTLKANGGARAEVAAGSTVQLVADIEVPPGAGSIVAAEWDFEGNGEYPLRENFDHSNSSFSRLTLRTSHTFPRPGTYFPALRAAAERQGNPNNRLCFIYNIGRARVVVR